MIDRQLINVYFFGIVVQIIVVRVNCKRYFVNVKYDALETRNLCFISKSFTIINKINMTLGTY